MVRIVLSLVLVLGMGVSPALAWLGLFRADGSGVPSAPVGQPGTLAYGNGLCLEFGNNSCLAYGGFSYCVSCSLGGAL